MPEGPLRKLDIQADSTGLANYTLVFGGQRLALAELIGRRVQLHFLGRISCAACARETRRSYGGGYCYPCFKRLARCDLCLVHPVRCHAHLGTCREPSWAEGFCWQPHLVYLAETSGLKVGITRLGQEHGRWLDQGAIQALPLAHAASRRAAGLLEQVLARQISDRTNWRRMLLRAEPGLDLPAARRSLRDACPDSIPGIVLQRGDAAVRFHYPLSAPGELTRWRFTETPLLEGTLRGAKGQFLCFDQGVFNVHQHRSYHVRIEVDAATADPADPAAFSPAQKELFS